MNLICPFLLVLRTSLIISLVVTSKRKKHASGLEFLVAVSIYRCERMGYAIMS